MFSTIFKKELLDQLINPKFLTVFFLCLILIPPSFLMNYSQYKENLREYEFLKKTQIYAECNETISIYGEMGTGKSDLAKAIHCLSPRKEFPFVYFDGGLLCEYLADGELFGHVRGAFTGAVTNRIGILESTNRGTFFIDEIGNLPLNLQVEFLRITKDRKIRRLGHNRDIKIGLQSNGGKFKSLSKKFNYDYDKFMGFLRHHNLKSNKMEA